MPCRIFKKIEKQCPSKLFLRPTGVLPPDCLPHRFQGPASYKLQLSLKQPLSRFAFLTEHKLIVNLLPKMSPEKRTLLNKF